MAAGAKSMTTGPFMPGGATWMCDAVRPVGRLKMSMTQVTSPVDGSMVIDGLAVRARVHRRRRFRAAREDGDHVCLPSCARGRGRRANHEKGGHQSVQERSPHGDSPNRELGVHGGRRRPYAVFGRRATTAACATGPSARPYVPGGRLGLEPLHRLGERVDLVERRVEVRRDADALELGVHDRGDDDPRRSHRCVGDRRRARCRRCRRCRSRRTAPDRGSCGCGCAAAPSAARPSAAAGSAAAPPCVGDADGLVEDQRLGDGVGLAAGCVPISSNLRMSSGLRRRRRQRPQRLDQRPAHVEEPGADRRQQPLVQAGAVVVALEIADGEREVGEGVRAVDDGAMPRARAIRQIARTGKICPVRFVMWQKWITFVRGVIGGSNAARGRRGDGRRNGERDLRQHDPVARTRCSQVSSMRP